MAGSVSLVIGISIFIFLFYPARQARASKAEMRRHATELAHMVALGVGLGLERSDYTIVTAAVEWAKLDSSLTLLALSDTTGEVFATYDPRKLGAGFVGPSEQRETFEVSGLLVKVVPVVFQGQPLGRLVLGLSLEPMNAQIARDRRVAIAVCLALALFGTLVAVMVAGRITRPIVRLTEAAERMAAGDYDLKLHVESGDEVGALTTSFDRMASRVRDAVARLDAQAKDLASARDTAVEASRAKAEFLAVMSHEIRTPMNGVLGLTNLLADTQLDTEQRQYVESALLSAQGLMTIINDILDFSKMEAGKLVIEPIPFDMSALVSDVADTLAPRALSQGIELVVRYDPATPCRVIGDPGRVRQILLNLAGNAVKFTSKGHVIIRVEGGSSDGVAHLRCEVIDTGIGIAPEILATLYQPFVQADAGTTRKFGGTGLGLSITKQLVELMGGEVGVQSAAGVGSTFWFTLALPLDLSRTEPVLEPLSLNGAHALVVDDIAINVQVFREWLRAWGMRVKEATDGEDGLHVLRKAELDGDPIRVVLVDYLMPVMDGERFGRAVRSDPILANTLLVLATSAGQRGDSERFREAGFDAYLVKPFPSVTLRATLGILLAREGERRAGEPILTRYVIPERAAARSRDPARAAMPTAGSGSEPASSPLRVLLAEDNKVNQLVAVTLLRKLGCQVDVAVDGQEAIEMTERATYAAVFMDMQMPRLDGLTATRLIREREAGGTAHLHIVAMTANAMEGDRETCLAAGMDDYVSKPISAATLAGSIERLRTALHLSTLTRIPA